MSVRFVAWAFALAIAFACGSRSAAAQTLVETFDDTELSATAKDWVSSGSFTNATNGLVWTYLSARGNPQIATNNPALALRGVPAAQRGTLALQTELTNGIGAVSFTAKLASEASDAAIRLDFLADGKLFATCAPSTVGSNAVPCTVVPTLAPLQAVSSFCISNRGSSCAIDDLTIEPFRVFVALSCGATNEVRIGREFDVEAQLFHISSNVVFEWSISPEFAGGVNDWRDRHLTLMPDTADLDKTFTLTAHLAEADAPEVSAEASCTFTVSDSMERFIDFEDLSTINYDTNSGVIVSMPGMNWRWFNVCTSDKRDAKIGEKSARFRHISKELPAIFESQDPFDGIRAVTLHCACFQSNRTVTFELQVSDDRENWKPVEGSSFSSLDCLDITNCVFQRPVGRRDQVYLRLVTTGQSGQIANIDDIHILPYTNPPPVLAAEIPPIVLVDSSSNSPSTVRFTLSNADGIVREWTGALDPPSEAASFEPTPDGDFLFTFDPTGTNEWGHYTLDVSATLAGGSVFRTQAVLRVVSAPTFELVGTGSVEAPGSVEVMVTNVVLHGNNTEWETSWVADPPFVNTPSLADETRYCIDATEADRGTHVLTVVLTDVDTTASATNTFPILVLSTNIPPEYRIESYTLTNLSLHASNPNTCRFTPFAIASPAVTPDAANWIWQGEPQSSVGERVLYFNIPASTNPAAVFGVLISPADDE